jgi:hypothetical protein
MNRLRLATTLAAALVVSASACTSAKHAPMIPASQLEADAKNAPPIDPADKPTTPTTVATKPATEPPPVTMGPISVTTESPEKVAVKVLDAGAKAGRRDLTFKVKAGDKQKVNYVLNAAFSAPGGDVTTFPTTVFAGETEIRAVTGKDISYRFVSTSVDVRAKPDQAAAAKDLRQQMQVLKGLVINGTVDTTGLMGRTEYSLPNAPDAARNVLQEMLAMFPIWMLVPSAPMGNGATWQVTRPFNTNGISLTVTYNCKLALAAGSAKITATAKVTAPSQDLGQGATMTDVTGTGTFAVDFDNTRLYGNQTAKLDPSFTLKQDSQSAQVGMSFAPEFELPTP